MAGVAECEEALQTLATRMASSSGAGKAGSFDRTLSCHLRDLDVTFVGRLHGGRLTDIRQLDTGTARAAKAQIGLDMTSDDLLAMVNGTLNVATAWASRRIKIDAGKLDLLRLRTIF